MNLVSPPAELTHCQLGALIGAAEAHHVDPGATERIALAPMHSQCVLRHADRIA
jgi:hypothetical protein